MSAVDNLKTWFEDKLTREEQKEVLKFLYGGYLIQEGMYCGPNPEVVQKGLFCGPSPSAGANVCPTCGRPR